MATLILAVESHAYTKVTNMVTAILAVETHAYNSHKYDDSNTGSRIHAYTQRSQMEQEQSRRKTHVQINT